MHKHIAITFLHQVAHGKVQEAFDKYVAPHFKHHNSYFSGDRESLLRAMQEAHETSPNKAIEIKKTYIDGDTVITHSLVVKEGMSIAVIHIFRFERDQIVELWDIGQVIDPHSPNENGLF